MKRSEIKVLSIDPGATVGWSLGMGTLLEAHGQDDSQEFLRFLSDVPEPLRVIRRVVIERFDVRQFTSDSVATVELIGAIKWLCSLHDWPIVEISASDKVKFRTYASQYIQGQPHAADAEAIRLYDLEYGKW